MRPTSTTITRDRSRDAQRRADKWMLPGAVLMTTAILGPIGFPLFLKGMSVQRKAQLAGLSVRPMICTLLGYLVIMDSGLNSIGWSLDLFAHHSLVTRALVTAWGNMFDSGYFWHYNELWIGGAGAPGEKSWEIALVPTCFCMRLAAAIGFLQMKRWGHQWLIVTCWFGVIYWVGLRRQHDDLRRPPLRPRRSSRWSAGGSTTSSTSRRSSRFRTCTRSTGKSSRIRKPAQRWRSKEDPDEQPEQRQSARRNDGGERPTAQVAPARALRVPDRAGLEGSFTFPFLVAWYGFPTLSLSGNVQRAAEGPLLRRLAGVHLSVSYSSGRRRARGRRRPRMPGAFNPNRSTRGSGFATS